MPGSNDSSNADSVDEAPGVCLTRVSRVSQPCDHVKHFPETENFQQDEISNDGVLLKPYFVDEYDWTRKLGKGVFYKSSSFSEDKKCSKETQCVKIM